MTTPVSASLALGDDGEDHPRRLLEIGKHLVAYGGDHGTISLLEQNGNADGQITAKVTRRFDDAVRAVAVSHDLLRVAVGFDDGSTKIFAYDKSSLQNNENELHPFLTAETQTSDDASQDFLSQSDGLTTTNPSSSSEKSFLGPRFDAPVRHMQFDPRSYHLAIATEAGLCIVDVTTSKSLETRFLQESVEKEHDSCGIRGVSYGRASNNKKMLLATLAMDGRLCIWDVTAPNNDPLLDYELLLRDANKCVTQADVGEINGANSFDRSCLPVFGKDFLALPGLTDVQLRRFESLKEQLFLSSVGDQGHTDTIVAMTFSPDDGHLVTSGRDGRVVLWELDSSNEDRSYGKFVAQLGQFDSVPTYMIWQNRNQEESLYMATANGSLLILQGRDKIVPGSTLSSSSSDVAEDIAADSAEAGSPARKAEASHKRIAKKAATTSVDSDDETVDFSGDDKQDSNKKKKKTSFVMDEAEEDDDTSIAAAVGTTDKPNDLDQDEDDDLNPPGGDDEDDFDDDFENDNDRAPLSRSHRGGYVELPKPQPAFAPSSTPLDLTRRIMCWNHLGTVSLLRGEDGMARNTVDIEFTDAATRRPVSFTDNMSFILGSLGEDGGIFATDLADDDDLDVDDDGVGEIVEGLNMSERTKALVRRSQKKRMKQSGDSGQSSGSSVYFHRFNTFGALRDKDWYLTLPDGERAMGCACGEGWAAVMTSRRFLRFFSSGGNQGPIMWLKGEPVTIVGRSTFVAVIYHEGSPLPNGTQKLGYSLFDGLSARLIASGSVSCISNGSKLTWAGFSNDCSLLVMDSDGMLSMLVGMTGKDGWPEGSSYSWEWAPMLDTVGLRKSADDNFFPITCQDGKLVCVPLKGGNEYPDAIRRPVTTTLSLRMPVARDTTLDKSMQLEEISVRANLALTQKKFLNEALPLDVEEKAESKEEYAALCAQVDKVTLKLFMSIVETGKLERALDLAERLHLEKSLDVAMTIADRLNHRNLSDRIYAVKERRFAMEEEPMEDLGPEDYTPHDDFEETESTTVSPEWPNVRKRTERHEDDWEEPKEKKSKTANSKSLAKPSNPFAKKKMESPARPSMSPGKSTPLKPALSRLSTFSAQSREKTKSAKKIL